MVISLVTFTHDHIWGCEGHIVIIKSVENLIIFNAQNLCVSVAAPVFPAVKLKSGNLPTLGETSGSV